MNEVVRTNIRSRMTALGVALLAIMAAGNAHAGFVVVNPQNQPTALVASLSDAPEGMAYPGVHENGIRPVALEMRKGFVRDVPLSMALRQIAPRGWRTHVSVQGDRRASWETAVGGEPWLETLAHLVATEGVEAHVDWQGRIVRVSDKQHLPTTVLAEAADPVRDPVEAISSQDEAAVAQAVEVASAQAAPATDLQVAVATTQLVEPAAEPVVSLPPPVEAEPAVPPPPPFDVRQGETLMAALTRWSAQSGWTLMWKSADDIRPEAHIQMPVGMAFEDAVRELMRSVWVMYPDMTATAYKNKVLVVESNRGVK